MKNMKKLKYDGIDLLQAAHRAVALVRGIIWSAYAKVLLKNFRCGSSMSCFGWPKLHYRNGSISLGSFCHFGSGVLKAGPNGSLIVGDRVMLNSGFVITSDEMVTIGNDVMIGEYVSIRDSDHTYSDIEIPMNQQGITTSPVKIEDDVWVGRGAAILKGVTVGRGAIVAANSLVNKNVEPFSIVGGVPAKQISSRVLTKEISA
ncbi:acyltransferase [Haliea sp. E17]|uniref:acyltransferase n=1 Tax=Haliea sp. E17 TaxID=3401576 RepID=UPI003AAF50F9